VGDIQRDRSSYDASAAAGMFHYLVGGTHPAVYQYGAVARAATGIQAFTKLSLAFLNDIGNPGQLAIKTNLTTAARALAQSALHPQEGAQLIRDLGLVARQTTHDIYALVAAEGAGPGMLPESLAARAAELGLRTVMTPMTLSQKIQSVIMANGGAVWAQRLDKMLASGDLSAGQTAWLRRQLDTYHFSPKEIDARFRDGGLSPEDVRRIQWETVDQVLFYPAGKARQTEFAQHPLGRVVLQFRNWVVNQGRLLNQSVIDEMRHGNYAPAARMVPIFPILGELYLDGKSLVTGVSRPDSVAARVFEDVLAVGGLAQVGDLIQAYGRRGATGALQWASGASLTNAADIVEQAYKGVLRAFDGGKNPWPATARWWVKQTPFVGQWLSNQMRTDAKAMRDADRTWDQRLGLDSVDNALRQAERDKTMGRAVMARALELAAGGDVTAAQTLLEEFNQAHGTALALNPTSIQRRQEKVIRQSTPEGRRQERLQRLPPAARSRIEQEAGRP
jgi:hypothetical protein